jgi:hypothetical protein
MTSALPTFDVELPICMLVLSVVGNMVSIKGEMKVSISISMYDRYCQRRYFSFRPFLFLVMVK